MIINRKAGRIYHAPVKPAEKTHESPIEHNDGPSPPCEFLGKAIPPAEGQDVRKRYSLCMHPDQPLGNTVCSCQGCGPDCTGYTPEGTSRVEVGNRHLVYHVHPVKGSIWRWRVAQIVARWRMFRSAVVTIGQDETTGPADEVIAMFPTGTRVIVQPANKVFGETAHWHAAWSMLLDGEVWPEDIILRAHAKGVTRPIWSHYHEWADWLIHTCCDYPDLLRRVLSSREIAGPLLLQHAAPWNHAPGCSWHYSGSWYWVRASAAREKYQLITTNRFGVESWPGMHHKRWEAGRLFRPPHDLRNEQRWLKVQRAWIDWSYSQAPAQDACVRNPTLHLVTPVTRPQYVSAMTEPIKRMGGLVKWHQEPGDPGTTGGPARMRVFERIANPDDLVYCLDDDTLPHPHLVGIAAAALAYAPDADGWIVGQRRGKELQLLPGELKFGGIDTGSVIWRRRALEGLIWPAPRGGNDWKFIESAVKAGRKLVHIPAVGSLYNWLR